MNGVYIQFDPWARMGNRMFQYAFGYLLAQKKNIPLYSEGLPNFNIPNTQKQIFETSDCIRTSKYGNNIADIDELLNTKQNIIVDSFLQKHYFYTPHISILQKAFNIQNTPLNNTDKLIVHIRETDYLNINCFLGYEFYKQFINKTGYTNVIIVTDNSDCDTVKKLISDGCILHTEGCINTFEHISNNRSMLDFNLLLNSKNIAISQSSFSWWPALLGMHDNIFFPFSTQTGMWKLTPDLDDIDLFFNCNKSYKIIL